MQFMVIVFKTVKDIEAIIVTQKVIYPAKTMMTQLFYVVVKI